MCDAVLVDDGVRRDRARDQNGEPRAAPATEAAYEQDARPDEHDAARLARVGARTCERDGAGEHEHRREPARERVDDRQLRVRVRVGEQPEVGQLERRARDEERPDGRVEVPEEDGHRCADDRPDEQDDHREGVGVARSREQQVPHRVDDGRAERENESLGRQR